MAGFATLACAVGHRRDKISSIRHIDSIEKRYDIRLSAPGTSQGKKEGEGTDGILLMFWRSG